MGWKAIETNLKSDWKPKFDAIDEGARIVDARIYWGKYCDNKQEGVLLSEIVEMKGGKGYLRWISEKMENAPDDLIEAAIEVLSNF